MYLLRIRRALQRVPETENEMSDLSSIEEEPVKAPRIEITASEDRDSLPSYISLAEVESSKISPGATTPAGTPCGEVQEVQELRRPARPLPFSDPFISLTSFDAKTKPGPTDRPSPDLAVFLAAIATYNLLTGIQLGQDVKVERFRSTSAHTF